MPRTKSQLLTLTTLIAIAASCIGAQAQIALPDNARRGQAPMPRPTSASQPQNGPIERMPELRVDRSSIGKSPEQLFPSTPSRKVVLPPDRLRVDQMRRETARAPMKFLPLLSPSAQVIALAAPDMTGWAMLTTGAVKGELHLAEFSGNSVFGADGSYKGAAPEKKLILARGVDELVRGAFIDPSANGPLPLEAWKFVFTTRAGGDDFECVKSTPSYNAQVVSCAFSLPDGKVAIQYYYYLFADGSFYSAYNPPLILDGVPNSTVKPFLIGDTVGKEALYDSSDYDEEKKQAGVTAASYSHMVNNYGEVLAAWDGQDRLWLRKRRWFADFKLGFDTGFNTLVPRPDGPDQWVKSPFYLFGPMRCAGDGAPVYCTAGRALPEMESIQLFSNIVKHDDQPLPSWTNLPKAPPMLGGPGFDKAGIAIALLDDKTLLLAARDSTGGLQTLIYNPGTQQYSAWRREGGAVAPASTPVCTDADGKAVCIVKAPNGQVWQKAVAPR